MKIILLIFLLLFIASPVQAVCPVCTIAVAGGLGISRWLGIDDVISGIWIGGLILSSSLWLSDWAGKKRWKLPYKNVIIISLFYLFTVLPLYWAKMIGVAGNTLWGIDKVILGIIIGSVLFFSSVFTDRLLRLKNNGKVYIYYQKVIIPVFLLSVASFFFYLITS